MTTPLLPSSFDLDTNNNSPTNMLLSLLMSPNLDKDVVLKFLGFLEEQEKTKQEQERTKQEQEKTKQEQEKERTKQIFSEERTKQLDAQRMIVQERTKQLTAQVTCKISKQKKLDNENDVQDAIVKIFNRKFSEEFEFTALDTRYYQTIRNCKPDFVLVSNKFKISNISDLALYDGLSKIAEAFLEVKVQVNKDDQLGQVFNYIYKARESNKQRTVFIAALMTYSEIHFIRSYFSETEVFNEITVPFELFNPKIESENYTSKGVQYLYSMMKYGNVQDPVPTPQRSVKLLKLLGFGATCNVYKVSIKDSHNRSQEYAMKLCSSNQEVISESIQRERAILQHIQDIPNTSKLITEFEEDEMRAQTNPQPEPTQWHRIQRLSFFKRLHGGGSDSIQKSGFCNKNFRFNE
ncbi:hypothetical protein C9374_005990 [Naegleria lovaniensis]|uniref:Protein kinase domain-containing protein n=1 Tax=Naegleria lovaniensis TaxID=51637 RepID=A0AA88KML9_NAELO|nr:uncharacterized protein C9374_014207 [Naegleria lovaniensis]XP_044547286.1 uncharacterized protein C9374_005990 [Naegleria lovaniensis]KAG2370792.1 hypothetical protein C9374_014207 [Naegleria lovaniensis]KAG2381606.1 hypothetical protein C9374_005990 [Naegleria lovaniensis]